MLGDGLQRPRCACRVRRTLGLRCVRLAGIDGLRLPVAGPDGAHAWHLFVVQSEARDALQAHLARAGCETLVHYPKAVYRFPPFAAHAPAAPGVADGVAARVLSLPMGPHLADADVHAVCAAIVAFHGQAR